MKTIKTIHVVSKFTGSNYIAQFDDWSEFVRVGIGKQIFMSGYIIDSNNKYMPVGQEICVEVWKCPSNNIIDERPLLSCEDYEFKEILFVDEYPNWFERLFEK